MIVAGVGYRIRLISVTSGAWITDLPAGYALSQMRPLGIPMPIYFMVILTAGAALWMRYSAFGRAIYAVGGNPEAARLSGVNVAMIVGSNWRSRGTLRVTMITEVTSTSSRIWRRPMVLTARSRVSIRVGKL